MNVFFGIILLICGIICLCFGISFMVFTYKRNRANAIGKKSGMLIDTRNNELSFTVTEVYEIDGRTVLGKVNRQQ
jgi:hypothetical protein